MSNDTHKPSFNSDDLFGEPISVYTTDQAIEDGILFEAGRLGSRRIILTSNLLATIQEPAAIAQAIVQGMAKAQAFESVPDTQLFSVGDQKLFVSDDGASITLMLPEDY